ncbi:MAG: PKD domain-containing protein, partial [Bacteroidetes bacterium]|nr:PKD domain-containing protein [Bacteroidota bacterium]
MRFSTNRFISVLLFKSTVSATLLFLLYFNFGTCSNIYGQSPSENSLTEPATASSINCPGSSNDSADLFVVHLGSDQSKELFLVRLEMFLTEFERYYFYDEAHESGITIQDKKKYDVDSAVFITSVFNEESGKIKIKTLIHDAFYAEASWTADSKRDFLESSPFQKIKRDLENPISKAASSNVIPCESASVACSGNIYTFPSNTSGSAPTAVGGYPNYGCLGSEPCPVWYYMQISKAGNIIINIKQNGNHDVDFICWGPFNNLTEACATGLTGTCSSFSPSTPNCCDNTQASCANFYPRGNIVDCSYDPAAQETCTIPNGQIGEIYLLLITNFSLSSATLTFSQTGGTGLTDCNIVEQCSMIAFTANPGSCDPNTNTFPVSGILEFSNPPAVGNLTITDITAIPNVSTVYTSPFASPMMYSLSNIPCDGAIHSITASFSDSVNCKITRPFFAPAANCPIASISGGGIICGDGNSNATISIQFSGIGPFNFAYAINGVPRPPILNYSGPSPYVFTTDTAGTYTLASFSNQACEGAISGSAVVIVNPVPIPTISGMDHICLNSAGISYTTEAGFHNYHWVVSAGGIISSGGGGSDNYVNVTWTQTGSESVSVIYSGPGPTNCTPLTPTVLNIIVDPLPSANAGPDDYICNNVSQYQLHGSGTGTDPNIVHWTISGGDGTLSDPNILNPIYFAGPIDLSMTDRNVYFTLSLEGTGSCAGKIVTDQVLLRIDPTPIGYAGPSGEICDERPYPLQATAQYQNSLTWTTSGDGTFSNPNIIRPTYTPGPADVGNTVKLTMNLSGCKSLTGDDYMMLTVHPDPSATISGSTTICEKDVTPITIDLAGIPPWNVTYTNGISLVTVTGITTSPYIFQVSPPVTTTYWISAGNDLYCDLPVDSIRGVASIIVNALPDPFYMNASNNGVYCEGDTGIFIGLNGSEAGMNYQLYHNGVLLGSYIPGTGYPLHFGVFRDPGQYTILGINPIGNCIMPMTDTVIVIMSPTPVTDFVSSTICEGDSTRFSVSGNYINKTSYWLWDFGDGTYATYNTPNEPSHIFPTHGTFIVTLTVEDTNNCRYTISHPVIVRPNPVAFFSYSTPNCIGSITQFIDLSTIPDNQGFIQQWVWNFGDGSPNDTIVFPENANVRHNYLNPGTYTVNLNLESNHACKGKYSTTITVSKGPKASFTFWNSCQNDTVSFYDGSIQNGGGQITGWHWDFGDPTSGSQNISNQQNPIHTYANGGSYLVGLATTNFDGCSDTISDSIYVKQAPVAEFTHNSSCLSWPTLFWA